MFYMAQKTRAGERKRIFPGKISLERHTLIELLSHSNTQFGSRFSVCTVHMKNAPQHTPSQFHSGGENKIKSVENILTEEHAFIYIYVYY